jgi:hypothetical protein
MNNSKTKLWGGAMVIAVFFMSTISLTAQATAGGELSIGPRFGGSSGLSLKKHAASNKSAFEFLFQWSFDDEVEGFGVTALWEKLAPLSGNRLAAMFGAGPATVFGDEFRFGIGGIIGFDWRISKIINLQMDWQPTWYFVNGSDFSSVNLGFTVRYVLNHRKLRN